MKFTKKIMGFLLSAVMFLSMSFTALAAENSTLTIETTAGHTYKVYQLLIGDVSELTDGSGTLANVTAGVNLNGTVEAFDAGIKDADGNYLTNVELGNAAAGFVTGAAYATVIGTGSPVEQEVADGYYVVEDTWTNGAVAGEALSRYMVAVVGDTTMTPKAEGTPDIDKNIVDTDANAALEGADATSKKTDTAAIGDVIEYEVTGTVPNMTGYKYYYYVVTDTMSEGLTLRDDATAYTTQNGFEVTVGGTPLVRGTDYYVYKNGQTFELAFENMLQYTTGAAISVKYYATVNENALIGTDPNTNTVNLTYSNNPNHSDRGDKEGKPGEPSDTTVTGTTPDRVTKTYVTQLTIIKTDVNGMVLDGAVFELAGTNLTAVRVTTATTFVEDANGTYYKLVDGTYTTAAPIETTYKDAEEKEIDVKGNTELYASTTQMYKLTTTVSTEATPVADSKVTLTLINGAYTVTGLNAGTYTLTETQEPTGYNKLTEAITITISAEMTPSSDPAKVGGTITWTGADQTLGVYTETVVNQKGNTLPSTGGIGTTMFYVFGGLLVLAGGVLFVTKQRMAR